ncbi:sialic acid-binding Ig-like lectin 14 [Cyprinus carpio]|uniref:Sialic acid-binding Ig-like lectin 14 n=1 Tax=Cyprinus carpio TaxID=7962 RepID=A0A9Q9YWA7_CYPCA|nr:sialic acid-binding Ig-like lectin 14 [Cyprinus carpio]XP_042627571.1 sialic acid-binding Ig-like lectin 14 [Cyprinus carpio]XP_042627572.1 sialic acid-binding Ig-like lectin 14 [Cyprinus carpio]
MDVRAGIFLYWLHIICTGVFADVWKVHVEPEMKALVSSCVVLPCSFKYPVQVQPSDRIRAIWHMKDNWDDIIFHGDSTRVKDSFKGRTKLIGSLGGSNCSLEIDEVKNHDNGPYCFRVELETSEKDKYSFVENCVSIKMIEQASKPELQAEQSVQEGETAVFKCSVRHTCPSHQPTLTWSHTGKAIMSYKDIGHGNWETESVLTFIPQKEDDHTSITCTVKHHGKVEGEMTVTHSIFVKEQATLSHILIPSISGLGAALLVGLMCFFIVKRYKKRIADLESRNDNGMWSRLSRMSRRFRSGDASSGPGGRQQRRSIWSRFSRRGQGNQIDRNFDNKANNVCTVSGNKPFSKAPMPSPKSEAKSYSDPNYDDDYTNTADLNLYGNI